MIIEVIFGKVNVDLLNCFEIDVAVVGNNEGIMLFYDELVDLYYYVVFFVIVFNLFDEDGQWLKWVVLYVIKMLKNGMIVGIFGVMVLYYFVY